MSEAVRASRAIPPGAWFGVAEREGPAAAARPVRAVRRVAAEAGRLSVADPARQPLAIASTRHPRGVALLPSAALHGALLAALLLSARAILPPEIDEVAVPLVFEPAPDAVPLAQPPPAPASPRTLEPADAPEAPVLVAPPADAAPASPLAEPPATPPLPAGSAQAAQPAPPLEALASPPAATPPGAAAPLPAPPRPRTIPPPPPVRPVPRLSPPRLAPPSPPASRPDGSARQAAPPRDATPEPLASHAPPSAQAPAARTEAPPLPPRPLAGAPGNVQPAYPDQARRRGIEGRVVIRATVSAAGRVLGVAVAQGSGSDALDRAALDAVRGYSFAPATRGGTAVEGVADLPFTFRLAE